MGVRLPACLLACLPACLLAWARGFSRDSGPVIWSIGQDWRWEAFFAYDRPARCARRIRLVAYGARLESVLGASPRGFESPILRHRTPEPAQVPGFSLCLQRKVAIVGEGCCSNESRVFPLVMELEGNTRGTKYEISATVVWMLVGSFPACGAGAAGVPGAAWPASSGRAAWCARVRWPARESSALRAFGSARRLEARPGPAAAHGHRSQALRLEARPGPTGLAAASNRACLSFVCCRPGFVAALGHCCLALRLEVSPGLVPLDPEPLDDLRSRERGEDLARHEQLRAA